MTNPTEGRLLRTPSYQLKVARGLVAGARGIPARALAAVGAGADENDLVLVDGVAEPARDTVDRTLQPCVAERLDLAAVAANEMVMVLSVGGRRLVRAMPSPASTRFTSRSSASASSAR